MPQIVRGIRHNDIVARLGRNGFESYNPRDAKHRCGPSCSCRSRSAPTRDVATAVCAAVKLGLQTMDAALERLKDSTDRLGRAAERLADQRREMLAAERERAAASGGIVSATAGYVRDAAGNRIRPMTTADLQAIADRHYGRVR